jgi:pyruvate, orthophosphate dikinase
MSEKWVYSFNAENTDGNREMSELLGGKGANLAEMSSLKLPVPPGFTVTTEACLDYEKSGETISESIKDQVKIALSQIEKMSKKTFGSSEDPLLFSVRSGARTSMPGMMDTVLNLGLCDKTVEGLAKQTQNPRFAWDSYRRFIQMYANVVMGLNVSLLEATLEDLKEARGVKTDTELSTEDWKELVVVYKRMIIEESGRTFPTDPYEQLWESIAAVFGSWNNARAQKYREIHDIPDDWGTAVNVQSMVFGNMGDDSGTGVCFTRDPSTGENTFFGEYLINAQGEDVVAGIRTPCPINNFSKNESNKNLKTLEEVMPQAYVELTDIYQKLEGHYKDMQDIEFTIEKDVLYILQTRNGKRTAAAGIKIAVDLYRENILSKEEALLRVNPEDLNQLLHPRLDPSVAKRIIATGLPASPGAASGEICFDSESAQEVRDAGRKVLLVRQETSPEDIAAMVLSEGILTARGGMTSHAAVVARGMGKPCVAGCSSLSISYSAQTLSINGKVYNKGDRLTIDGSTGEVMSGLVKTIDAKISDEFAEYMSWADEVKSLSVRTNADNPNDAKMAIKFGAEGIGLCRTEHMFFEPERILAVREMIFSENSKDREKALDKIFPFQKEDFVSLFRTMHGQPVNIRLLDPPLHEFLPEEESEKAELAQALNISVDEVNKRIGKLGEFNPMLGHRGCRLAITFPEIYRMQTRAISEALFEVEDEELAVETEIMIPLVATAKELSLLRNDLEALIQEMFKEKGKSFKYKIGTMIELPRAAITAGEIAEFADFFSFGTNDLTQTTLGLSRDDAGKFLPEYVAKGIFPIDPFVSIDQSGVGFLIKLAAEEGKKVKKGIHLGICGEHAGEPQSIDFCHRAGLDYVSCSPFRVPIARLSAAQSQIRNPRS